MFDVNSLRSEQEIALCAFLTVNDVFVNLSTGSEKSVIYQLAPLLSSRLKELSPNSDLGKSDAVCIVVSPMISIMFFAHSLHSNVPTQLNSNFKFYFIPFNFSRELRCFKSSP